MGDIKVRVGRHVYSFREDRLKSTLSQSTSLNAETINEIVKKAKDKLSSQEQPIGRHDITSTVHFVMIEMNLRNEGKKYIDFVNERRKVGYTRPIKISYINCPYCNIANPIENEKCSGCGAALDRKRAGAKVV